MGFGLHPPDVNEVVAVLLVILSLNIVVLSETGTRQQRGLRSSEEISTLVSTYGRWNNTNYRKIPADGRSPEETSEEPPHRIRHGKTRLQHRIRPSQPNATVPPSSSSSSSTTPVSVHASDAGSSVKPATRCYAGSELLLVIAATCAVNLAFMLAVLALVLACNRPAKPPDSPSPSPLLLPVKEAPRSSSYSSVQDYVDSLPADLDLPGSMLSLHSLGPNRRKSSSSSSRRSLHAAFSMEDLLFTE